MRISELSDEQKGHLAWRLDAKTATGYITACRIARGQHGDLEVVEVFRQAGMSDHAAKIHARKVANFRLSDFDRARLKVIDAEAEAVIKMRKRR